MTSNTRLALLVFHAPLVGQMTGLWFWAIMPLYVALVAAVSYRKIASRFP